MPDTTFARNSAHDAAPGRGDGQWRRYAGELAQGLPLLQPWRARFGDGAE